MYSTWPTQWRNNTSRKADCPTIAYHTLSTESATSAELDDSFTTTCSQRQLIWGEPIFFQKENGGGGDQFLSIWRTLFLQCVFLEPVLNVFVVSVPKVDQTRIFFQKKRS